MCEVGRIKHHLKHNLYRPESTILFVGYQAEGTLGKRILSGEKLVKIFGEEIAVNAEIQYLDAFSGHADKNGLLNWIEKIEKKPKNIFIVHGEIIAQQAFKQTIWEKFKIPAIIPGLEESYTLDGELVEAKKETYGSNRLDVLEALSGLKHEVEVLTNTVKAELKNNVEIDELADLQIKIAELKKSLNKVSISKK
ncbi:Ribonuclease [compost metagenome]